MLTIPRWKLLFHRSNKVLCLNCCQSWSWPSTTQPRVGLLFQCQPQQQVMGRGQKSSGRFSGDSEEESLFGEQQGVSPVEPGVWNSLLQLFVCAAISGVCCANQVPGAGTTSLSTLAETHSSERIIYLWHEAFVRPQTCSLRRGVHHV